MVFKCFCWIRSRWVLLVIVNWQRIWAWVLNIALLLIFLAIRIKWWHKWSSWWFLFFLLCSFWLLVIFFWHQVVLSFISLIEQIKRFVFKKRCLVLLFRNYFILSFLFSSNIQGFQIFQINLGNFWFKKGLVSLIVWKHFWSFVKVILILRSLPKSLFSIRS